MMSAESKLSVFPATRPSNRKCANCEWWMEIAAGNAMGICRGKPPTAFMLGFQNPTVLAKPNPDQMIPIVRGFFATSGRDDMCKEWEQKMQGEG